VGRRTPLFELHQELGARIVDFGGWDMPVQYASQIGEHHAVRRAAGIFDVSHMCAVDLKGPRVRQFLQHLLANDVAKLKVPGKALYSCMLNEAGGVLDDLIVYFLNESAFRLVVNAGTRDKDLAWIRSIGQQFDVQATERTDLAILAVQGPEARAKTAALLSASGANAAMALGPFFGRDIDGWFVARTGYTGEDGFEVMLPASDAVRVWRELNAAGVVSCGLGARDTLRLEMCYPLNGSDLSPERNPIEAGLGFFVDLAKPDFVGRDALLKTKEFGPREKLVPFRMKEKGPPPRPHYAVFGNGERIGEVTSGTLSPSLNWGIGMAYVSSAHAKIGVEIDIEIRAQKFPATVEKKPLYRKPAS